MLCSPRRCLAALVMLVCLPITVNQAAAQWTARFPGGESVAFPVDDGRYFVTVALPGQDAGAGRLLTDGRPGEATPHLDPVSRLVIFRSAGPAAPPLAMRAATPPGDGFPVEVRGGARGTTAGWVRQVGGKVLPLALLKIDYQGKAPAPGQPLLDVSGRLVAVAYESSGERSGYALPVEVVHRALDGIKRDGRVLRARLGLSLKPGAPVPQVLRVLEGSPAGRAGVKVSDVLLEVGGRKVGDYADAVNAFYFLRPAVTVRIKVRRGDGEVVLVVTPEAE